MKREDWFLCFVHKFGSHFSTHRHIAQIGRNAVFRASFPFSQGRDPAAEAGIGRFCPSLPAVQPSGAVQCGRTAAGQRRTSAELRPTTGGQPNGRRTAPGRQGDGTRTVPGRYPGGCRAEAGRQTRRVKPAACRLLRRIRQIRQIRQIRLIRQIFKKLFKRA